MLGLETFPARIIAAVILMVYVSMGGAHTNILSDGVQSALMIVLAVFVLYFFLTSFGVEEGGLDAVFVRLEALDPCWSSRYMKRIRCLIPIGTF